MIKLYSAIYTDERSGKVLYRLNLKNVWNKYFWEKAKLEQLEILSRKNDVPKSSILIEDTTENLTFA